MNRVDGQKLESVGGAGDFDEFLVDSSEEKSEMASERTTWKRIGEAGIDALEEEESEPETRDIRKGEKLLREVGGISGEGLILSAERERFLAHLKPRPREIFVGTSNGDLRLEKIRKRTNEPVAKILGFFVIGEQGAQVFCYDDEYAEIAHGVFCGELAKKNGSSGEEFLRALEKENKKWQENFRKSLFEIEKEKVFAANRQKMVFENGKKKTIFGIRQRFREAERKKKEEFSFDDFLRGGEVFNEGDYSRFRKLKKKVDTEEIRRMFAGGLREKLDENGEPERDEKGEPKRIRVPGVKKKNWAEFNNEKKKRVNKRIFEETRTLRDEVYSEYLERNGLEDEGVEKEIFKGAWVKKRQERGLRKKDGKSVTDESIERRRAGIISYFADEEQAEKKLDDLIENCREYIEMAPRYLEAKKEYEDLVSTKKETETEVAEFDFLENKLPEENTNRAIFEIKQRIARLALGTDEVLTRVFILPTGILASFPNGEVKAKAILPDDEKVLEQLDPDERKIWTRVWKEYPINGVVEEDRAFRRAIVKKTQAELTENPELLPEKEREIIEILKQYKLTVPPELDEETGIFRKPMANFEDMIRITCPRYGDFVKKINFSGFSSIKTIRMTLEKNIKEFLLGNLARPKAIIFNERREFNMVGMKDAMEQNSGDREKIMDLATLELGGNLYADMGREQLREFVKREKAEIESREKNYRRVAGRVVKSEAERKSLACRWIFLKRFLDYTNGAEQDAGTREFFDKLKKD